MARNLHERLEALDEPKLPADRSFGLLFAVVFALVAAHPRLRGGAYQLLAGAAAAGFLLTACLAPARLHGMNAAWMRLGRMLGAITNPVVCGVLFFTVFVPLGFALRLAGKLNMAREAGVRNLSSWVPRTPPGPDPSTMRNQF